MAHKACRDGYTALYTRASQLFRDLAIARADGSLPRRLLRLSRLDVLIVDDWAMAPMNEVERRDFLEVCDDRYQRRSTILTSQLPVAKWHAQIGDPTLADSILDRLGTQRPPHRTQRGIAAQEARPLIITRRGDAGMTPLTLKRSTGFFAAGPEVQQALTLLSDGAFKLFVWVCLHADRRSARLRFRHGELARRLGKSPRSITSYLRELQLKRVCQVQAAPNQHRMGSIEIADRFWPYHKQNAETTSNGQANYIEQVRKLFLSRSCVQATFSPADERLAAEWQQRRVPLARIEHAYLLGCARKYVALATQPATPLISSLRYFTNLLAEVAELSVSDRYWRHLARRVDQFEQRLRESAAARVGHANFAPANPGLTASKQGETR